MRLLDPRFKYTPSMSTDITKTWKRHGFKATTETERQRRLRGQTPASTRSASVTPLNSAKRKLRNWNLATPKVVGGESNS